MSQLTGKTKEELAGEMCIRDRDNTESMVFDPPEIMDHGGLFGVDREEWEKRDVYKRQVERPV